MGISMKAILLVARLDEMGVLTLRNGQTLLDIAEAIDVIQKNNVEH